MENGILNNKLGTIINLKMAKVLPLAACPHNTDSTL